MSCKFTSSLLPVQVAILSDIVNNYKKKNQSQDILIAFLRFHAARKYAEPTDPGKLYSVECGFRLLTKWPEIVQWTWSSSVAVEKNKLSENNSAQSVRWQNICVMQRVLYRCQQMSLWS